MMLASAANTTPISTNPLSQYTHVTDRALLRISPKRALKQPNHPALMPFNAANIPTTQAMISTLISQSLLWITWFRIWSRIGIIGAGVGGGATVQDVVTVMPHRQAATKTVRKGVRRLRDNMRFIRGKCFFIIVLHGVGTLVDMIP